jgi:hypothetical protein
MGSKYDWLVKSVDPAATTVTPSTGYTFDLINVTKMLRLKYARREYGIDLVWAGPGEPSIRFQRSSASIEPLRYGESIAIGVRNGGYLRYRAREYGINLVWSTSPVFEWTLAGDGKAAGDEVGLGDVIGLFNTVASDFLFYDPRRYGIDLKWFKDKGKFNSKPWYERVINQIEGWTSFVVNVLKDAINRLISAVDFILTFFGIMLPKKMRLRVVILRNESGQALLGDPESPTASDEMRLVNDAISLAREVFKKQTNTTIVAAGGQLVTTVEYPAPTAALDVACVLDGLAEDLFEEAGRYFRRHLATNVLGTLTGYGAPVTAFFVRDIKDKHGCSNSVSTDYVTVASNKLAYRHTEPGEERRPRSLAHEIGHAGLLWHPKISELNTGNLMTPGGDGLNLELLQRALFRSSRHVTFF